MTYNVLCLLLLFFFVYTIIGCYLFSEVPKGINIDDYVNFKNFLFGMMTLFKLSTGDNWTATAFEFSEFYSMFYNFFKKI